MATSPSATPPPSPSPVPPVEIVYMVPIGAVIAWYQPLGTTLPPCFALCDGGVVQNAKSPFDGQATPDLRGRFPLGAGGAIGVGATGGDPNFTVAGYESPAILTSPTQADGNDNMTPTIIQANTPSNAWRYILTTDDDGWQDGNHHHVIPSGTIAVSAPGWAALQYIMRII